MADSMIMPLLREMHGRFNSVYKRLEAAEAAREALTGEFEQRIAALEDEVGRS